MKNIKLASIIIYIAILFYLVSAISTPAAIINVIYDYAGQDNSLKHALWESLKLWFFMGPLCGIIGGLLHGLCKILGEI